MTPAASVFLSLVDERAMPVTETGCLLWTGPAAPNGYGKIRVPGNRIPVSAHCAAYEAKIGQAIDQGMHVCHKCDTKSCVNPDHLFLGTRSDNMRDMVKKGRHGAKTRPEKTKRGADNPFAKKMSQQEKVRIAMIKSSKKGRAEIAKEFGISVQTVWRIKKGLRYGYIDASGAISPEETP